MHRNLKLQVVGFARECLLLACPAAGHSAVQQAAVATPPTMCLSSSSCVALIQLTHNGCLQVTDAISRKRKEETVAYLTETLEKSIVLFGVRFKNIPVRLLQPVMVQRCY